MKPTIPVITACLVGFLSGYYVALPEMQDSSQVLNSVAATSQQKRTEKSLASQVNHTADINSVRKMKQALSVAETELEDLKSRNASLARQVKSMDLPLSPTVNYNDLVAKIDNLPVPLLEEQLNKLFDDYALKNVSDTREFSKRLLDVALSDSDEPNIEIRIEFSTSPLAGLRLLQEQPTVGQFDSVFGHISSADEFNENVIVKWQDLRTGEIFSFRNQSLNTNGREQYIWARPKNGWQVGQYKASIFTMDNSVTPLGSGIFSISAVHQSQTDNDVASTVMQDLINSGQALPLVRR